jgi:phosphatidylglycerophosphate synthase
VRVANGPEHTAALIEAVPGTERVAVVDPRFVGHVHALRLALTDPRFPTAAVTGALTAQPAGRTALTGAVRAVSATVPAGAGAVAGDGVVDGVTAELEARGVSVHHPELGSLVAAVPSDAEERHRTRAAVDAVDDEAVRLRSAVKARDGFFTTFCISPYSRYIARWCARRGLTPNHVTTASLLTALVAAGCAATGTRAGYVAAGLLLLFSFVLDCTDGQLARYSLQYSTLGAWLDATFDRAKEYAYYAGLALGAARGGDDVWALALGAMVLQTCRHVVDFSFNEANHDATANTSPTAALSSKLDSVGWTVWLRRMIVLPIGERWAMIAVLTAVATPRIVFYALLVGCSLAACYTTAGRVLRSLTRKAHRTDRAAQALADLADSGPAAEAVARATARAARKLPGIAPLASAAVGAAVLLATAGRRPRVRRHLGARRRPASQGRPRLARPPCLPGRRVRHDPAPRRPRGGERGIARRFRAGSGCRLPSLRHGVPHPRWHGRAAALAGPGDRRARGAGPGSRCARLPGARGHHRRADGPRCGRGGPGAGREHPILGVLAGTRST